MRCRDCANRRGLNRLIAIRDRFLFEWWSLDKQDINAGGGKMKVGIVAMIITMAGVMSAKMDCWMTFCKTPGGQQYS